ncbi:hypothetical protein HDV00_009898, partial [Rhizophlyctis rosea]
MNAPRFLSGFNEIEGAWLIGKTYVSGVIQPSRTTNVITQLGTSENPFNAIYGESYFNRFGELRVNQIDGVSPINVIDNKNGIVGLGLSYDSYSLQVVDGKLSVKPRILYNNDYDLRYRDPIKVAWDVDRDPSDTLGGELFLDFEDDDFNLDNGKLKAVPLNITGQGAIDVRKADWTLGENDAKLRVVKLDVSEDFQQTGGVLAIRNQGNGK